MVTQNVEKHCFNMLGFLLYISEVSNFYYYFIYYLFLIALFPTKVDEKETLYKITKGIVRNFCFMLSVHTILPYN